jgi:uncharacterized membrane protein YfcA
MFLATLGFIAGVSSGFLGIGGGLIIVPALTLMLGYPIKRAVGASLGTIVGVSLIGAATELLVKRSNIHWALAVIITAGSVVGARLAARLLVRLPEHTMRMLFAASLLIAAYRMLACLRPAAAAGLFTLANHPYAGYAVALPVGLLGGLTSTLFGLGGGIVTVPGLTLLFGDVSFHAARATSLVTMMPTSSFGARHHYRLGTLDLGLVKQMLPTAVLGALVGVFAVNHIAPGPCRAAFAVVLLAVAVRLLIPARRESRRETASVAPYASSNYGAKTSTP